MVSWDEIKLDSDKLLGVEPADFLLDTTDTINEDLVTDNLVGVAKDTIREMALETLHNLAIDMGGEDALFDAIAAEPAVTERLQSVLLYAFLHHFYRGELISTEHVNADKAEYYYLRLEQAMKPFVRMTASTVAADKEPIVTRKSGSVRLRSNINWYNI